MRPYAKTIFRSIRMTLPRFLAIFAIIALGVGFFTGLKVTTPSFVLTGDLYLKQYALYDFKLLSTIGFDDEDIAKIAERTSCVVEGSYTVDCSAYLGGSVNADTVQFISITKDVNKLDLVSGRLPEAPDEIVIDAYKVPDITPGTKLVIADETSESSKEMFRYDEYTVVGTARSPIYMNFQRGISNEGSGSINYYVCALPEAFDSEYYTEAYLYADTGLFIYSDEYKDWAANAEKQYKEVAANVIDERFDSLIQDEYEKIYDGFDEFNEELDDAWTEIEDGRAELDDAKKQLEEAQEEIDENRKTLEDSKKTLDESYDTLQEYKKQLTSAKVVLDATKAQLDSAEAELAAAKAQLDESQQQIDDGRAQLENARAETAAGIAQLEDAISQCQYAINEIDAGIKNLQAALDAATTDEQKAEIQAQIEAQEANKAYYQAQLDEAQAQLEYLKAVQAEFDPQEQALDEAQQELDAGYAVYNENYNAYINGKAEYDAGYAEYESSKALYDSAYDQYWEGRAQYNEGVEALEEAQQEVDDGWEEYNDGVYELWQGYSDYSWAADEAFRTQLVYGYTLIASVDEPEIYALGRDKNTGYVCFDNDSQIVDGISNVFPIFFFAIAALVCSTTMSRMVTDERGIIGTMRALGFSDTAIVMKYAIYAGSAAILGSVLGFTGGTKLFPTVIWEVYKMMYGFAPITYQSSLPLFLLALGVALICTVGVTVVTALSALKGMPAELIRPKAPLPGKRILLEYIGFIWKKLKFLHKVSLRNVFRFKKRMWMMIVGIAGCTSLLLTAFGLYDSICNVVDIQYDNIMRYDVNIMFDEKYRQYEIEEACIAAGEHAGVNYEYAIVKSDQAKNSGSGYVRDVGLFISDDPHLSEIFGLMDVKTGETVSWPPDGEVAISEKLADKNRVKVGDTVTLLYGDDDHEVTVKVGAIFKNYTFHYVFMTPATYREYFGKPYTPETLLISTENKTREEGYKFAAFLSDKYELKTWSSTADSRESFAKTMERMNYVVVLVIGSAAALAFIVLFNLNNINITERVREIATLKVMGFNRRETGAYVTRENIMLVLMGFIVGIPLGILLHRFVMAQIAMDMVTYELRIDPQSYLYSLGFVLLFSTIVNLIMRAKIEKIDMAESLKSAE